MEKADWEKFAPPLQSGMVDVFLGFLPHLPSLQQDYK